MPAPRPLLPLLLAAALCLGGCVEVSERLAFERDGNGTYALTLRWNADLLQRVRETVGERALAAFEGRAFPLRADDWRESLRGLHGVKVTTLEEQVEAGGWRAIRLELAFTALDDLRVWELFGRRTLSISGSEDPRRARLAMEPFTRLHLLDPLLEARAARRAGLPAGEPGDPGPMERLGLEAATVDLVDRLLAPHLPKITLESSVAPAGRVTSAGERAATVEERSARFRWSWADLEAGKDRSVTLDWTPGEFERVPVAAWRGDAKPAGGAPDGG